MCKFSFDAVIFDLDGVITQTAVVHNQAWESMFDDYLLTRAKKYKEPFKPFDFKVDYLNYVDGKPRYKGVESFLKSRGITLPFGKPGDPPVKNTICGLGNRKNILFNKLLKCTEVKVFETTINFIKELKSKGIKIGVASSSESCKKILVKVDVFDLFDVIVDGIVSKKLNLKGKPEPDIFLTACDKLGVSHKRSVIVEDAVSGVQAGMKGGFGLVLGIDRQKKEKDLEANGADLVVKDLSELDFNSIEQWFKKKQETERWSIYYPNYLRKEESIRESLCTVGNGYFGTRGALEESKAGEINYPGTYLAGVYNRLETRIGERIISNEDMVNCPNWLPLTFKIGSDEWVDLNRVRIISFERRLNLRDGLLFRKVIIKDNRDRETLIESSRIASMANPHLGALKYTITPLNYSGNISIRSGLDGSIINSGVERYRILSSKHLELVKQGGKDNLSFILVKTNQSKIEIALTAKLIINADNKEVKPNIIVDESNGTVFSHFNILASESRAISVDKIVAIYTSKDIDITDPLGDSIECVKHIGNFQETLCRSKRLWNDIWKKIDIEIQGDEQVQKLVRFNLYHLIITVSPHNVHIDGGFPARGLHGEAYRGHIFWDELFVLPFYNIHFPEISRSILLYRYKRLGMAKRNARSCGYEGALYPWQSGSDGSEQSQVIHLNPVSGKWGADYSSLQYHVSLAIALNIWQYYWMTGDTDFMANYGAEIFFEICRFWASKVEYDKEIQRYEIKGVMGPDEYHEKYPDSGKGGLKDNSYTNIMVVWLFRKALEILNILSEYFKSYVVKKISLKIKEIEKWRDISKKMNLIISEDGLMSQFDGYFGLKELDWKKYINKKGNVNRMERLLKAEGISPDEYKISKQADTLMTFYNLPSDEVGDIINELGYSKGEDTLKVNFDYYIKRTSHDSTLSLIVHSYLAHLIRDERLEWEFYLKALNSDYGDIQCGTTGEGIHTGVMGGVVLMTLNCYAGLDFRNELIGINPCLPQAWQKISFNFTFKHKRYYLRITRDRIRILIQSHKENHIRVLVYKKEYSIKVGQWKECYKSAGGNRSGKDDVKAPGRKRSSQIS
ncbi:MAG: beta-phosphoglucomutase family hydrolase [Actinobacteria bacterium]|nr:beta-phosphoglucomutase family hydrolase [Actinomycetota bacterium]